MRSIVVKHSNQPQNDAEAESKQMGESEDMQAAANLVGYEASSVELLRKIKHMCDDNSVVREGELRVLIGLIVLAKIWDLLHELEILAQQVEAGLGGKAILTSHSHNHIRNFGGGGRSRRSGARSRRSSSSGGSHVGMMHAQSECVWGRSKPFLSVCMWHREIPTFIPRCINQHKRLPLLKLFGAG